MTTYSHTPRRSIGMLAAAAAVAATMTATVVSAPPADATCASFFGIGNNANCQSTLFSVAIAIGNGATATASSVFGTALAFGTGAGATAVNPFTVGITAGENSFAFAQGLFGIAVNLGSKGEATTLGSSQFGNLGFNIALSIPAPGNAGSGTTAAGIGNIATTLFGRDSTAQATGILNTAANIGANGTSIYSGVNPSSVLNSSFKLGGSGGTVVAGPGPFAIAGSILQTGANITKSGPGININGLTIGGAAANRHRTPSSAAAKAASSTPKPASPARARR